MARRFTDTDKWRDDWWASLPNDKRIVWLYLVDSCTTAGIWKKDMRGLNFNCNVNLTENELVEFTGDRLVDCGKFFFIPAFIRFQNPTGIQSDKPAVKGIRNQIEEFNLMTIIEQRLGNRYLTVHGKGKGKGKGIRREKKKEEEIQVAREEVAYPFDTDTFREAWGDWKAYKKTEHRFAFKSPKTEQTALNELAKDAVDEPTAIAMIKQAIAKNWKGLYELKSNGSKPDAWEEARKRLKITPA